MIEIVHLALKAVIDSFEIYTINSLKKIFESNFITSKALFGVTQPKQNKKYYYIITGSSGPLESCFE